MPGGRDEFAAAKNAIRKKTAQLERLLNRERAVQHILRGQEDKFRNSAVFSESEKNHTVDALQLQRHQLNQSQLLVDNVIKILNLMLGNITSLDFGHMKDSAEMMHKVLSRFAVEAEEINNRIDLLDEKHVRMVTARMKMNASRTGMDEVVNFLLRDISDSVDKLQDQLHGHETQTFEKEKGKGEAHLETVVRLESSTDTHKGNASDSGKKKGGKKSDEGKVTTLIDSKNNQYTLRRPTDTTLHYEDLSLMNDVITVLIIAFVGGLTFYALGMPNFFGYVLVGVILSPTGMNKLENIVQVETLSGFGVFFIMFLLGLEFSFEKLWAGRVISVVGGLSLLMFNLVATLFLCYLNSTPMLDGVLIGFCVSLSSTAIVLKCLEASEATTKYGSALLGILIIQDIALGVMLALLPVLNAGSGTDTVVETLKSVLMGFVVTFVVAAVAAWKVIPPILAYLKRSKELYLLCAICIMMTMLKLTEYLGLSMELGCFIAGLMISIHPEQAEHTVEIVEPIRDMFACVFFVTMGLHIYPSFLLSQVGGLMTLTALVVTVKYSGTFMLFAFYYRFDYPSASLVALGLSQISEFSFVLASHGRQLGIISREAYFLLLGTTALSFLSTPFLWRLSKRLLPPPTEYHVNPSDEECPADSHPAIDPKFHTPIT